MTKAPVSITPITSFKFIGTLIMTALAFSYLSGFRLQWEEVGRKSPFSVARRFAFMSHFPFTKLIRLANYLQGHKYLGNMPGKLS